MKQEQIVIYIIIIQLPYMYKNKKRKTKILSNIIKQQPSSVNQITIEEKAKQELEQFSQEIQFEELNDHNDPFTERQSTAKKNQSLRSTQACGQLTQRHTRQFNVYKPNNNINRKDTKSVKNSTILKITTQMSIQAKSQSRPKYNQLKTVIMEPHVSGIGYEQTSTIQNKVQLLQITSATNRSFKNRFLNKEKVNNTNRIHSSKQERRRFYTSCSNGFLQNIQLPSRASRPSSKNYYSFNDTIDGNQSAQKIKQIIGVKQPSKKLTRASAPIKLTIEQPLNTNQQMMLRPQFLHLIKKIREKSSHNIEVLAGNLNRLKTAIY